MLSQVERTIAEHGLFRRGERVLVGLSGGVDSWALLLALWKLRERLGIEVHAAVVDHGLRAEAAREARAVAGACAARGIPVQVLRLRGLRARAQRAVRATRPDPSRDAAGAGRSPVSQDAARAARLAALARLARRLGCARIALGHQAEDQAETVLFRIVRGTGLDGLAGIPYRRGPFVRPLLDVRRDQIERFVARHGVTPVRDPSNADVRFARARLRHRILPLLRAENPRVDAALVRLSHAARGARRAGEGVPVAGARAWSVAATQTVQRLRRAARGSHLVDVRGARLAVEYGRVSVRPAPAGGSPEPAPGEVTITRPGRARLWPRGPGVELRVVRRARAVLGAGWVEFDADAVAWPLRLRTWRAGDRLFPRGGVGRRKLQDLFVDAKVPRARRAQCPVLVQADGTLLYVAGLRPAEAGKPGPHTRAWLRVRALAGRTPRAGQHAAPRPAH